MSEYVNKMRGVLVTFNRKAMEIGAEITLNNDRLVAAVAREENAALRLQLKQGAVNARDQINEILKEAETAARKWAELSGKKIDKADLDLLKGGFEIASKDLRALVAKHWDNGVMINAISKYAKEHRIYGVYVPNLDDKLQAYAILAKSAHNCIANITDNVGLEDDYFDDWGVSGNVSDRLERALYGI